jgi:hypothetical protein
MQTKGNGQKSIDRNSAHFSESSAWLWLIVASYGVGHTYLAQAHKAGHGGSETLFATLFFAGAFFWGWINFTDRIPFKVNDMVAIIGLLILIILGVNANTGFFGHVY